MSLDVSPDLLAAAESSPNLTRDLSADLCWLSERPLAAGVGDAHLAVLDGARGQDLVDDLGRVERLAVVDHDQDLVLQLERGLDLLGEDLLVETSATRTPTRAILS